MKDYKALAEALRYRVKENTTFVHIGLVMLDEVLEALEEASKASEGSMEWRRMKDGPPKEDGVYLTCDTRKRQPDVHITIYSKGDEYWDLVWKKDVTHWMPRPKLPDNLGEVQK